MRRFSAAADSTDENGRVSDSSGPGVGWRLRPEDERTASAELAMARAYAGLIQSLLPVIVIASVVQLLSLVAATIIWTIGLLYVAGWFVRSAAAYYRWGRAVRHMVESKRRIRAHTLWLLVRPRLVQPVWRPDAGAM